MSRTNRKPVTRWIGEALLIFLSVLGAFYFDNLREEKNEKQEYIRTLNAFKTDLETNIGKFNFELATTYDTTDSRGFINGNIQKLSHLDSLLSNPSFQNTQTIHNLLQEGYITGLTKWIFVSPQYDLLIGEFNPMIKNDKLRFRVQMHFRDNEGRISIKDEINDYVKEFRDIEDLLSPDGYAIRENQNIIYSNPFRNKVKRLLNQYENLQAMTENTSNTESMLIEQIDAELALWGISDN